MELNLWNEKRYAPYKIAALVEVLEEQGIVPATSLSGTGLMPESLADPETLTSIRQYITVCRNALQFSKTPETPFRTGSQIPLSAYGMYGFALVCSPTIREYFQVAVKYHQLATPLLAMSWHEEDNSVSWIFPRAVPLSTAEANGLRQAEQAGVNGEDAAAAAALRALPISAFPIIRNRPGGFRPYPILDGQVFPDQVMPTFEAGKEAKVPLIIGGNSNEASLTHPGAAVFDTMPPEKRDSILKTFDPQGSRGKDQAINDAILISHRSFPPDHAALS